MVEDNGTDNNTLDRLVDNAADDIRTRRALDQNPALRGFAETRYQAKSWNKDHHACARIEGSPPRRRPGFSVWPRAQ